MRTCNGVGSGGMDAATVERFDADLAALLAERYPEPLRDSAPRVLRRRREGEMIASASPSSVRPASMAAICCRALIAAGYRVRAAACEVPDTASYRGQLAAPSWPRRTSSTKRRCGADSRGCDIAINLATSPSQSEPVRRLRSERSTPPRRYADLGAVPAAMRVCRASCSRASPWSTPAAGMRGPTKRPFTRWSRRLRRRRSPPHVRWRPRSSESGLDWIILRGGLFYGPGTDFDDDWFARARARKLRHARGRRRLSSH